MKHKRQAEWDAEEMDRLVGLALQRLRDVSPGANNAQVRQVCGEVESAHRLHKPASLRDALTALHVLLDDVEQRRTDRERVRG